MFWVMALQIAYSLIGLVGNLLICRHNWKRYGLLWLISSVVGIIFCSIFVAFGWYVFPYRVIPKSLPIPIIAMFTALPFVILISVRYSPLRWAYKIPYYWAIVHLIMLQETIYLFKPRLIDYLDNSEWDVWDSYTWWWIFLLLFEWLGGKIVPAKDRAAIDSTAFRYGRWAWIVFHFIIIMTIFLGGVYVGYTLK